MTAGVDARSISGAHLAAGPGDARTRQWVAATARAGALAPWVQPIFDRDVEFAGGEVLARCPFPDGSLRSPDSFAAALHGSDVWTAVDTAMLIGAGALARLAATAPTSMTTHWNTAVSSLSWQYFEMVEATIAEFGIVPADLVLELTEHVPLRDGEPIEVLRAIRALGVGLAIDDIGENPSLFLAFRRVGVDWVKFERPFSHEVSSPAGRRFLSGIVAMAHDLGAAVVAEGIETDEMLHDLLELGCDRVQGNLLGPAVSAETFRQERLGVGASRT